MIVLDIIVVIIHYCCWCLPCLLSACCDLEFAMASDKWVCQAVSAA